MDAIKVVQVVDRAVISVTPVKTSSMSRAFRINNHDLRPGEYVLIPYSAFKPSAQMFALMTMIFRNGTKHEQLIVNARFGARLVGADAINATIVDAGLLCAPPLTEDLVHLKGAIVVVRRGACSFNWKVRVAQNSGALAVLIASDEDLAIQMSADEKLPHRVWTIPSWLLVRRLGEQLLESLGCGLLESVSIQAVPTHSRLLRDAIDGYQLKIGDDVVENVRFIANVDSFRLSQTQALSPLPR